MTTERPRLTARARILGWIMLIVAVALLAIVLASTRAQYARADARASLELSHEASKFRTFADGLDPGTGTGFASVEQLLSSYLAHNISEETETFFSVIDGRANARSAGDPPVRLDRDSAFVRTASAATTPVSGRLDTEHGTVAYAVIPAAVAGDEASGALVVVENLDRAYDETVVAAITMSAVAVVAIGIAGAVGWVVAGRVLAPVREVREAAAEISESDLTRRIEVTGTDDVAQLASTFNRMLDRLQAAFDGQRRFLDDAGHELRTPLTVIRGHLELVGGEGEDDVGAIELVRDEVDRMSRLVDDLILLARSERPGFLSLTTVELTDLVVETLAKATALGERAWSIDALPEGRALADQQRLTQALLQLASNAVAHTSPGGAIAIGGERDDDRLRLWVRDDGAGVPVADRERIFDRFARGSDARTRPGSGIGLSIVSRIAEAHGGSVEVESGTTGGARFVIDLPLRDMDSTAPVPIQEDDA